MTIKKNKGGRPKTILTKAQIKKIEELSERLTIKQIADYLGIGETTFFEIQKRQPEVREAYKKGKTKADDWVVSKLMQKIEEGDTACTLFYLKTKAGWSEKQQNEAVKLNLPKTIGKEGIEAFTNKFVEALQGFSDFDKDDVLKVIKTLSSIKEIENRQWTLENLPNMILRLQDQDDKN